MGTIRNDYQRFLVALAGKAGLDDAKRMANVIWQRLDALSALGATRRARSIRLAPVAIRELPNASVELPSFEQQQDQHQSFTQITQLTVGPFRGFMQPETFDLSRAITLVYGANGTGKSSFCEALEWSLLGSISEAQNKRIDQRAYCNNARLRRHDQPRLVVNDELGLETDLHPNEEAYRFCFIEKNRIEGFARISSRTPADQRQLIATLFGVDQFNEFVRGFNQELDENLNLQGAKAQLLAVKRSELALAEQTVRDGPTQAENYRSQEDALARRVQPDSTFPLARNWLLGVEDEPGRLAAVRSMLDASQPVRHGLTIEQCEGELVKVLSAVARLRELKSELSIRSSEVSYQKLYEAVRDLAGTNEGACPACGTPLDAVQHDPYERAQEGLKQLAELAELQKQEELQRQSTIEALRELHALIQRALSVIAQIEAPANWAIFPDLPERAEGSWLQPWLADERAGWKALLEGVAGIERHDEEARQAQEKRAALIAERGRLEALELEITGMERVRDDWHRRLEEAETLIRQFEADNQELIREATAEGEEIVQHRRVADAYAAFLAELRDFMTGLPAQLLRGLGQSARDFYNGFNRDDDPGDLLANLFLPVTENEKIELEYVGEPGVRYDALHILSEGHIRCLGLAILLAKNIEQACPVVIFDDAVNAIDDDHRNGIWRTLFEGNLLSGKQVILTSHGEEFLSRIQQEIGANRVRDELRVIKFLPHLGQHELNVDTVPATKNYVLLAQHAIEHDEKRDALGFSRKALEGLTDRLWSWLGNHGDGRLELKLSGPRATYELNNKCLKLRASLRRRGEPAGIVEACAALDILLDANGNSIEMNSLNAGTHYSQRDAEFDRATVREVVGAIVRLDGALNQLQGTR